MVAAVLFLSLVQSQPVDDSVAGLMHRDDVQSELKLSASQKRKWSEIDRIPKQRSSGSFESEPVVVLDPSDVDSRNAAREKRVWALLGPDQTVRLRQLVIQRHGVASLLRPDVRAELGLTEDQSEQVNRSKANRDAQIKLLIQKIKQQKSEIGRLDPKKIKDRLTMIESTMRDELDQIMTGEQRVQLASLGGKPFAFSPFDVSGG